MLEERSTIITAVLGFCGVVLTALLGWFAARGSSTAQLQASLNDAFSKLTEELQEERAALIARVSQQDVMLQQQSGDIKQLEQFSQSLERLLASNGIPIPPRRNILQLPPPEDITDGRRTEEA